MNKSKPKESDMFVHEVEAPPTILDQGGRDLLMGNACPGSLQTQEFAEAWMKWWNFRNYEKKKKLTPTAIKLQLEFLVKLGHGDDAAIASLDQSMRNDWTGVFEPKGFRPYPPKPGCDANGNRSDELKRIMDLQTDNNERNEDAPHNYKARGSGRSGED